MSNIPKIKIPPWGLEYFFPRRYKNLYGGRGSGKSHLAATLAIARVAHLFRDPDAIKSGTPYYPFRKTRILSGREFNTTIETSVKTVLEEKIFEMGLNDQFVIKNDEIVHKELGSKIIFRGLGRNINNVRSSDSIDVWWFEEAQFLTEELMDVIIPTARHEYVCDKTDIRFKSELWFVWNPKNRSDWVWRRFVMSPQADDLSTHVNFYSNPFLPEVSLEEAEICRVATPGKYEHDWLGRPDDANEDAQVLPYKIIERCVSAWDMRPDIDQGMRADLGLDIALGGDDFCASAFRIGPSLYDVQLWRGTTNLNETAQKATEIFEENCREYDIQGDKIFYDAATAMEGSFEVVDCPYLIEAVGFGWAPTGKDLYWESNVTNERYFDRRNIQMATALRQRAMRTCRLLNGEEDLDPWECLFINPDIFDGNTEKLLGMLTQPTRSRNPTNDKWRLDKDAGGKLKSPDEFDALCLSFAYDSDFGLEAD